MDARIYELTDVIDADLGGEKLLLTEEKAALCAELKGILPVDAVVLAQVNPVSLDIEKNAEKALKYIDYAEKVGAKAVIFPELFLFGYPCLDAVSRYEFLVDENIKKLEEIAEKSTQLTVIIGFVEKNENIQGRRFYNSVAVLEGGRVQKIVRKSILANYNEFNDARHFEPAEIEPDSRMFEICGEKAALTICEEAWCDREFFERGLYERDVVQEVMKSSPRLLINCAASPSRAKKEQLKHNLFSFLSKKYSAKIIYANQVGASDSLVFDGASRLYDENGKLIYRAKSFKEQFFVVSPSATEGKIYPLPLGLEKTFGSKKAFTLDYEPDLHRTYLSVVEFIKNYFKKNGFEKAVLGLSGGLDSSVCAVLLADALGAENVFGVSMPSHITTKESKSDALKLAENLGIGFSEASIKNMFDVSQDTFEKAFSGADSALKARYNAPLTSDNIQARARAMILWGISNEFEKTLPIATSDKSELYMGYATVNGDMSGAIAPIADITKTKLFALAHWINKNRIPQNSIPEAILKKRPGAELAINPKTNKPLLAEEALMPYEFLDEIIWRLENLSQSPDLMIAETFIYEKNNPLSSEQKKLWIEKFFRKMNSALYKWSITPPACIIDSYSVNKTEYNHPISSKINPRL